MNVWQVLKSLPVSYSIVCARDEKNRSFRTRIVCIETVFFFFFFFCPIRLLVNVLLSQDTLGALTNASSVDKTCPQSPASLIRQTIQVTDRANQIAKGKLTVTQIDDTQSNKSSAVERDDQRDNRLRKRLTTTNSFQSRYTINRYQPDGQENAQLMVTLITIQWFSQAASLFTQPDWWFRLRNLVGVA